ncbi:hypothetical protein PSI23_10385 [Xenorhabdus sp. XENO-10]|uniref:Uncharacterized protein n=1 Tax=Xenorhabdus yunnanensis TaxID=3025878 RepID=A0ABT5LGS1_9GAMM|nr:hypothetical protein [Xenorhabdus yunnanensis]MDC9589693.1 hypothetical protein [Xenorhabdus yunnanensis]
MSLENTLQKNNALLEQQNTLMSQLIAALAKVEPAEHFIDSESVTLLPEHVEQPAEKKKSSTKKKTDNTPVDIETLDLETVVAVAVLFKKDAYNLTADKLAQARAVIEAVGADRNGQVDALDSALQGLQELKPLTKAVILDLCLEIVESWDDIPGITERREFAVSLLNEGKQTADTSEPEPELDYAVLYDKAQQALLRLAKGGYRSEAVGIVAKFGAKKLGDIPQEKLSEVLKLAEEAWVEE